MNSSKKPHHKKARKANKLGRNKIKCERYRRENRREANKARRAARISRGLRGRPEATSGASC